MISVAPAAEPADFDVKVRQPGTAFLKKTRCPGSRAWASHDYWRRAIGDLLGAYENICSYSGSWTKTNAGSTTTPQDSSVDHFIPKSLAPSKAYEWANYRLSRARLNNRKGNHNDVLDPFSLPGRWFTLDFTSFLVIPHQSLSRNKKRRVQKTIDRLRLNTDNDYVQERVEVVREYCLGNSTFEVLKQFWPFIACEMKVQDFDNLFLSCFQTVFRVRVGKVDA